MSSLDATYDPDVPILDPEDVGFILRSAEGVEGVIVGGQALNIWAQILFDRAPDELAPFGPFVSKDIDYWGMEDAAKAFCDRVNGEIAFPPPFSASPNTAVVTFARDGRRIVVDFLANVAGLQTLDPAADTKELALPLRALDGGNTDAEVSIVLLGPVQVLKSRIGNIAVLRRYDEHTIRQAHASVVVTREYIALTLEQELAAGGAPDEAVSATLDVARFLGEPAAFDAWMRAGIDPVRILEGLAQEPGWHPRFREHQIEQRARKVREGWTRRRHEAERRLEGKPS